MTNKKRKRNKSEDVYGEGNYAATRDYYGRTAEFSRRLKWGEVNEKPSGKHATRDLTAAERQALARSKGRNQDRRDARVMKEEPGNRGQR
jgi:hypothetical protein